MSRASCILLTITLLIVGTAANTWADSCAMNQSEITGVSQISGIRLRPNNIGGNAPHFSSSDANNAGNDWNNACAGNRNPTFSTTSGDFTVNINYIAGNSQADSFGCMEQSGIQTCGCTRTSVDGSNGQIFGATVYIFERNSDGSPCSSSTYNILRHELGHVQGLADVTGCNNRIMGNPSRAIDSQDCDQIDNNFLTPGEFMGNPDHPCKFQVV